MSPILSFIWIHSFFPRPFKYIKKSRSYEPSFSPYLFFLSFFLSTAPSPKKSRSKLHTERTSSASAVGFISYIKESFGRKSPDVHSPLPSLREGREGMRKRAAIEASRLICSPPYPAFLPICPGDRYIFPRTPLLSARSGSRSGPRDHNGRGYESALAVWGFRRALRARWGGRARWSSDVCGGTKDVKGRFWSYTFRRDR